MADAATGVLEKSNPFLALGGSFAAGLGSALGGQPSTATGRNDSAFDASGWNVNFGAGGIESSRSQEQAGDFDRYVPYIIAAAGVLIVWRLTRRK